MEFANIVEPEVSNNTLVFNSGYDFRGFVHKLQKQPNNGLNKFMAEQLPEFISLRKAQYQVKKQKSPTSENAQVLGLKIPDPTFASLLNKNGVIQIGGIVYKVTNKYTYIFKNREAFESYNFPDLAKQKAKNPTSYYIEPCIETNEELVQVSEYVYRAEICGGGGGGGGGDYPDTPIEDLDPYANLDINYPAEKSEYYRSGGKRGRLRGKTWNVNYFIYSSIGTKSKHERYSWLRWWDRTADYITLDSFVRYSYGEKKVGFQVIEAGLRINYGSFLDSRVNAILTDILGMSNNSTIVRFLTDQVSGLDFKVEIYKYTLNEGYDITLYTMADAYSHEKRDAKRIKTVFDWSTAIVSYPPGIKNSAVNFELEILRAVHTMRHDGYYLGFITDLRH